MNPIRIRSVGKQWIVEALDDEDGSVIASSMRFKRYTSAVRYQQEWLRRDREEVAYRERALAAEAHANALARAIGASAYTAPKEWLEVVDALEVAEDAWRESGDEDRAANIAAQKHNILLVELRIQTTDADMS